MTYSIIIALLIFLITASTFVFLLNKANHILFNENRDLRWQRSIFYMTMSDPQSFYVALLGSSIDDSRGPACCVYRISIQQGRHFYTLVKTFTDDDEDFNRREAQDLCDTLNRK